MQWMELPLIADLFYVGLDVFASAFLLDNDNLINDDGALFYVLWRIKEMK